MTLRRIDPDVDAIAELVVQASDVTLILDGEGTIEDLTFSDQELADQALDLAVDRPWIDCVTLESREKISALVNDALADRPPRWRQVTHASRGGLDIPVSYATVKVGPQRLVAIGKNLHTEAQLQQQLVHAQQSMERDYSRLRHAETRYRMLFRLASEAVLVVEADASRVVELNPAAADILGQPSENLIGKLFPSGFDEEQSVAINELLARVKAVGETGRLRTRTDNDARPVMLSASIFRQEGQSYFLIRLLPLASADDDSADRTHHSSFLSVIDRLPDAFVVTDPSGRIMATNQAFLELAQAGSEEQARGSSLDRWLGRATVDLNVLLANLREHGSIRLYSTTLNDEYGGTIDVEISAVSVNDGSSSCLGFVIRNVNRRVPPTRAADDPWPRSAAQITDLVGRLPLKELVRESTDIVERLCIETALRLTNDNRASAAEILGLSRQGLYAKLRRHGLGNLGSEPSDPRSGD